MCFLEFNEVKMPFYVIKKWENVIFKKLNITLNFAFLEFCYHKSILSHEKP